MGLFFKWIKQHLRIKRFLSHVGERREEANLDRGVGVRLGRHRAQAAEHRGIALHIDAGLFGGNIRKGDDKTAFYLGTFRDDIENSQLNLFSFLPDSSG